MEFFLNGGRVDDILWNAYLILADNLPLDAFHTTFEVCDVRFRHGMHHELSLSGLDLLGNPVGLAGVEHVDATGEIERKL